jgi:hypothetical protein
MNCGWIEKAFSSSFALFLFNQTTYLHDCFSMDKVLDTMLGLASFAATSFCSESDDSSNAYQQFNPA